MPHHGDLIRSAGASLIRLGENLGHAADVQWLPPAAPSKRNDTAERASGLVSNPTLDTATDERRLKVRAAVIEAETLLERMRGTADDAADRLEAALQGWAGERA
ncbi:hypothetical protein MTE01_29220 [Microbacterium testaceum]|uniref:Uncharacterized protein n=1 Tax=Microbacterium testaceum TaxID=2033 RepID=A0A4Y3QQG7_MICTE|nr:hypothetical protein [Microbacterium testaceum]GEB46977.1 hypothetical protein MTE01_29220 [Microbacterium testaceum]